LGAGDTLTILAGTYTGSTATITAFASGTVGNHTIIEGDPGDAAKCALTSTCSTIFQPTNKNSVTVSGSHFTIRKLRFDAINARAAYPIVLGATTSTDILIEDVEAYNTETSDGSTSASCAATGPNVTFATWRRVHMHDCGRIGGQRDHGAYLSGNDTVVEDSWMHDNSSMGMQCFSAVVEAQRCTVRRSKFNNNGDNGLVISGRDSQVYNNEVFDNATNGITSGNNSVRTKYFNNLVYNNNNAGISVKGNNSEVKNNVVFGHLNEVTVAAGITVTQSNNACAAGDSCGTTGKLTIAALTDCTVSTSNFTQKAGSLCINAGVANAGFLYNGSAPDIGAYETFTYASATINEAFLDVTLGMNLNVPVQPTSAGWSAACSGGANCGTPVVGAAAKLAGADSVVRLTLTGLGGGAVCEVGQTWTVSYNSATGATTDSALVPNTTNQEATTFTTQAVTNACGAAPPAPPGTPLIIYTLEDAAATADNTGSSGATDDGTWSGTYTPLSTGKNTFGVALTENTAGSLAIPHGNGLNPSTTALTVAFWVNVPSAITSANKRYFGVTHAGSDRFYISTRESTWRLGIQASNDSTASNLAVTQGWNRVCLSSSSGTDIATLSVNGTVGTGAAAKAFTSYTLPTDLILGSPFGASDAPGVTYDDFKLWTTTESCADDWAAAEPPAPPSAIVLAQVAHQFHLLRQTAGGAVEDYRAQSATVNVVVGGALMLTTQTDATVAGGSIAERLRYNVNGGAFAEVPDVMGSDGVAFYGSPAVTDIDILKGAVTSLLTGALTKIDGETQITADAVPVIPFTTNSSSPQRVVLRFDAAIVPGTTICFKRYTQQGVAYTTYTPTAGACVVIVAMSAGMGF
jgi:hypothetical protein